MNRIYMSFELFNEAVGDLTEKIKASGKKYKAVYTPPGTGGGMIFAGTLAKSLGIPTNNHLASGYLVVDDVINGGNNLSAKRSFDMAVLYYNEKAYEKNKVKPKYFYSEKRDGDWIEFWWDSKD